MKFTTAIFVALSASTLATAAPAAPTAFPADIQTTIANLQGYIQQTILAYAQNADQQTLTTAFTSAGRSLDFFLRGTFLPGGPSTCPQVRANEPLPAQAKSTNEAIAALQKAQLQLINVSLDAINNDFRKGTYDACATVRQYAAGAYQR